jgi:prepilin-type processing-associated H-X9-DG protein
MTLEEETARLNELLIGKIIRAVTRHRDGEIMIAFTDGHRLFVDAQGDRIECSVTGTGE